MTAERAPIAFDGVPRRRGKPLDLRSFDRTFDWRRDLIARHQVICERLIHHRIPVPACPICGHQERSAFAEVRGFAFVECGGCGHLYMDAQPDPDAVRRMYSEDREARAAQAKIYVDPALFERRVAKIATPKLEHLATLIPAGGKWVDVGCATGEILAAARAAGWTASGIETDPTEIEFARRNGFVVHEGFVTAATAATWVADASVISLFNIIEHVNRPVELVAALAAAAPSGAHVVIEVPRHPSVSSFANKLFPAHACRHAYAPEHLHVFSEHAMAHLLAASGLDPVGVWTFGQDFQELVSSACLATGTPESAFIAAVFGLTPRLQQAIDDSDFSDVLIVVARKP